MIQKLKFYLMGKSREKKFKHFLSLAKPSENATILDVGVADEEYSPFDNHFEKKYLYQHRITALSIHPLKEFSKRYPKIKTVTYNGGEFPFEDKQFSVVISNAVIEHVGDFNEQLLWAYPNLSKAITYIVFREMVHDFPILLVSVTKSGPSKL